MDLVSAIILGTLFGFVLHRVGASNPQLIINMLRLKNFHLMKTILLSISVASVLLFIGMAVGFVNPGHLSIKTASWGVLIGGGILGMGWALSGYCPGTGVAAIGAGRKDVLFFLSGGLIGAWFYMLIYVYIKDTFLFTPLWGGKSTLALTPNNSVSALIDFLPGTIIALVIAAIFGFIAWKLPD